ncbi:MAG: nucleotidyltransferase domain-containing protein [Nitrospirae bacterium]|nr:nucleotidyltransferase domain-containing protein [Nitrospirota bacterium]
MTSSLKNAIKTIVRVASPDKVILFGSHAIGRQKAASDYDILILKKNLKNQRRLVQKIYLNLKNIGTPIDLLAIDSDRFEVLKNDPYMIYFDAFRKGKVIYEKPRKGKRMAEEGKK